MRKHSRVRIPQPPPLIKNKYLHRGVGKWHPVGLITQRPLVQIQSPQPYWSRGKVVNTPPCHGGDRGFDPRRDRHILQIY